MATTAANGIFGFAPALSKTALPSVPKWMRHKASLVDLGILDQVNVGPLEVGGGPFPTFPYKSGYLVGGGATIQPRLENTLGWLMLASLGDVSAEVPVPGTNVHAEISATGSYPQDITTVISAPPVGGSSVLVKVTALGGVSATAGITVVGTDNNDSALTATFTLTAVALNSLNKCASPSTHVFKTITAIHINSGAAAGDKFTLVYQSGTKHTFVPKSSNPSFVHWIEARKYIPKNGDDDADSDLGETYIGCKPLSLVLTLPNAAPVTARFDLLGRDFGIEESIAGWTWDNEFEDWNSIPVGCETGGYIKFTGGGLSGEELKVVAAQVGWMNTPLDLRQEKIFGDPRIEDITIISRLMTYDVTVKWNNPELYRAIVTGSKTGLTWASKPMTGLIDVAMVSPGMVIGAQPYQLNIGSPEILWQMAGTPILAAGQAIMMRFTGTALAPNVGDYTTLDLINNVDSYSWPSS